MIHNILKNFCLITFALIGPITLPAGGIQKNLNPTKHTNNVEEIIVNSATSLYSSSLFDGSIWYGNFPSLQSFLALKEYMF